MKRLILPLIVALLAGIGGGTGYAIMSIAPASAPAHGDSTNTAGDSTAVHADSAEAAAPDSTHTALHPADLPVGAPSHDPALAPTPADSIRAEQAARALIKPESNGGRSAAGTTKGAVAATAASPDASAGAARKAPPAAALASPVSALSSALPEQRLAKIFGAMQAKDAGKVLEQMTDSDIRTVLGMMSDRQAAAILSTLSPPRAGAITRGAVRGAGGTP
jgi:hypothetical protein